MNNTRRTGFRAWWNRNGLVVIWFTYVACTSATMVLISIR